MNDKNEETKWTLRPREISEDVDVEKSNKDILDKIRKVLDDESIQNGAKIFNIFLLLLERYNIKSDILEKQSE
jgi:hypothetical protein